MRNLEVCSLRDRDRDDTWNLWDRDQGSQKWVSRRVSTPRPSLETPSMISTNLVRLNCNDEPVVHATQTRSCQRLVRSETTTTLVCRTEPFQTSWSTKRRSCVLNLSCDHHRVWIKAKQLQQCFRPTRKNKHCLFLAFPKFINVQNRIKTTNFYILRTITFIQQKFSQSDPVLIRPKLASSWSSPTSPDPCSSLLSNKNVHHTTEQAQKHFWK